MAKGRLAHSVCGPSTMSSIFLVALIVLPVMGALIAWAGDVIGYRLGKTRRSVFGLRPRTTARLVGIVVGAVLPLAGLGFAMVVSQDARDALLRIAQLRQQAEELGQQNQRLSREVAHAKAEAEDAARRAADANAQNEVAQQRLAATEGSLRISRAVLASTRSRLDNAKTLLGRARQALSSARSALSVAQRELARARADTAAVRRDLATTRGNLNTARAELKRAKEELGTTRSELEATRESLARTQEDLQEKQKLLSSAQVELQNTAKIERDAAATKEYLDQLETRLLATEHALARYRIASQAIIEQDVAYEPGQEIIRAIFESRWSQEQLVSFLGELLNLASAAALRHGIAVGPSGRAVRAVSPVPLGTRPDRVTEEEIVAEVASQIARGDAPTYVVIVRAWGRTFKQQTQEMAVEFWVAPNKVVFRAGEVIWSTTLDGSQPRSVVFRDLWQSVREIRRIAADRGMLPNPKTGHYGEVSAEDLLDALDRLLQIAGPARVEFVVTEDVRVAQPEDSPMRVGIQITPVLPDDKSAP